VPTEINHGDGERQLFDIPIRRTGLGDRDLDVVRLRNTSLTAGVV